MCDSSLRECPFWKAPHAWMSQRAWIAQRTWISWRPFRSFLTCNSNHTGHAEATLHPLSHFSGFDKRLKCWQNTRVLVSSAHVGAWSSNPKTAFMHFCWTKDFHSGPKHLTHFLSSKPKKCHWFWKDTLSCQWEPPTKHASELAVLLQYVPAESRRMSGLRASVAMSTLIQHNSSSGQNYLSPGMTSLTSRVDVRPACLSLYFPT